MAYGDRKADRVRLEQRYPVNLLGVDGTWRRSCFLLDVSETGARLEVEGSLDVLKAQEFFLVLSSTGLAFRRCELIRVDGPEVGVRYITRKGRGPVAK
jgi:PilZ domain-containing protein